MKRRVNHLLSWLLAGVLLYAGAVKVVNPAKFAENIAAFDLVPWPVAIILAYYVPWLEMVVGLGLLVPSWRREAAAVATALFASFALLWAVTGMRNLEVACGCFGGGSGESAPVGLARALILAAGAAWVCAARLHPRTGEGRSG